MEVVVNGQPLKRQQRCKTTGKVMYEKPEANERAEVMHDMGLTKICVYYHPACGTWHLGNDRRKR